MAERTLKQLTKLFLNYKINTEEYFNYKGQRFYFDFFIPDLDVAFECHGEQHFRFNSHFYETPDDFVFAKRRDRLKTEYALKNGIALVIIRYDEKLSNQELLNRVSKSFLELSG